MIDAQTASTVPLQEFEFILLRNFISEHFGIHFDDDRRWLLESKLQSPVKEWRFTSFFDYYQHLVRVFYLRQSYEDAEFARLINAITNNETYFFREPVALDIISDLARHATRSSLRILSAACSTGEEAFSLAMQLDGTGPHRIVGVDLDASALSTAQAGRYRAHAFRGVSDDANVKSRYFTALPDGRWQLTDRIRACVEFYQGNLLDRQLVRRFDAVDVIVCRNVIIYFSETARSQTLENFYNWLRPGGYLFLGHSESLAGMDDRFRAIEYDKYVYYQRVDA
jgi:chemotaxis protein methyltransferase CheR